MLPDFPNARELPQQFLREFYEMVRNKASGMLQSIKPLPLHEGHRIVLQRLDGSIDDQPLQKMRSSIRLDREDFEQRGMVAVLHAFASAARDAAEQQMRFFFHRFNELVEEAGQTLDAGGETFTFDLFMKAFEMIDIDFDENGRPQFPTFVSSNADLAERIGKWLGSDEHRKRFETFIEKKRVAWRDRESNRKLVS